MLRKHPAGFEPLAACVFCRVGCRVVGDVRDRLTRVYGRDPSSSRSPEATRHAPTDTRLRPYSRRQSELAHRAPPPPLVVRASAGRVVGANSQRNQQNML